MPSVFRPKKIVDWLTSTESSRTLSWIMLIVALVWVGLALWSFSWKGHAGKAALIAWMVYP